MPRCRTGRARGEGTGQPAGGAGDVPVQDVTEPAAGEEAGGGDDCAAVEVPAAFRVADQSSANWVVRKLADARAHAARVRAWAERELRRAAADEQWLLRRFGPELEGWLRCELERQGGRRRSVALPDGVVGLRRHPPRLDLIDEAVAAAWCERHLPDALAVAVEARGTAAAELARWQRAHEEDALATRRVLRDPLNAYVAETGEVPDGTACVAAEDRLYVK